MLSIFTAITGCYFLCLGSCPYDILKLLTLRYYIYYTVVTYAICDIIGLA